MKGKFYTLTITGTFSDSVFYIKGFKMETWDSYVRVETPVHQTP